jgi:hypothetical protein
MRPSIALRNHRQAILRILQESKVRNPRVFGSVVSEQDEDGSDLDILVDASPGTTLFDLGALQVELEELLGVPVDLLVPGDLPDRIRGEILNQARAL